MKRARFLALAAALCATPWSLAQVQQYPAKPVRIVVNRAMQIPRAPRIDDHRNDGNPIVEQGAVIEHFAFGEGDVLKSDGERVHARFERDGRIREVSLNVLTVSAAGTRRGKPYFKVAKRG